MWGDGGKIGILDLERAGNTVRGEMVNYGRLLGRLSGAHD